MKKIFILFICSLAFFTKSYSQNFSLITNGIEGYSLGNYIKIQFFSSEIVRVTKFPVIKASTYKEQASLTVMQMPKPMDISVDRDEQGYLTLSSDKLIVNYLPASGKVLFKDLKGHILCQEKEYGSQFAVVKDADSIAYDVHQSFILDKNETIYGLGQQQNGKLNQRNQRIILEQRNMQISIPFFQSIKGYGIYWDNYSPTLFMDTSEELFFDSTCGDRIDYYFINGGNADNVISNVRYLTGQSPLFPLWTMGYWQCRERYKSQNEVLEVLDNYRKLKIPLDGIIQDWKYWGDNGNWNSMNFDSINFPNPQYMIDEIHKNHSHFMISVWASFGVNTPQYKELDKEKMLFNFTTWPMDSVKPYNPFYPKARYIYWKYLHNLYYRGIDGWWLDSTEPDHFDVRVRDFDVKSYYGTFRKMANAFPLMTIKGVYENQRRENSKQRVFIMTRSAFMGQQRYSSSVWSGDVLSTWEDLKNQIPAGLNFSLCGNPYWNSDIGGFDPYQYKNALKNPAFCELYVRWFQFGTFCPIMRSHKSGGVPCEVYQFGKKGNWTYDTLLKYIKLRYRLLPYIYSICGNITHHAGSMMRALFMDYPKDENTHEIGSQYLFGPSIMVRPITDSLYTRRTNSAVICDFTNVKQQSTYLPKGNDWYDYWSNDLLKGGQNVNRNVPIDIMPIYIKSGSIIIYGPEVQYANEKKWDNLDVVIYPGGNCAFNLYEDEMDNYNYEQGKYSNIIFHWDDIKKELAIDNRKGSFKNMIKDRKFNVFVIKNSKKIKVHTVKYSGRQIVLKVTNFV